MSSHTFNQELREISLEGHIDWLIEQEEKIEELEEKLTNLGAMVRDLSVAFRIFIEYHLHVAVEKVMLDLSDDDIKSIVFFAEDDVAFLNHFVEFIKDYIKCNEEYIWPEYDNSNYEV